ncbi:DNA adenine methylase [Tessaracoccus bendigoensis DSM 12906]|uniref:DNA adenine methylase n=2 Tax=Tessaracoccus TaxID=72763 RepID=A0A1M6JNW2_9ACTN|nr:DNA adenine methylase [Tessaracoccus bendigoensis]SHJ48380.1 DNA adenine methylase [Tessaracoccus bendigoensis DSM 12906]
MTRAATPARKRVTISPLRYPGGKGLLYSRLRTIIRENELTSSVYVEPYAGGAGAALALLVSGQVDRIAINDLDPAVFAFWNAVVTLPDEFTDLVNNVELTVEEWERQREVYLTSARDKHLSLGFATFYLNRTNRSGVLNGGPIGGKDQAGNYKIDARFNREGLSERIRLIALHADRIAVTNEDGLDVISRYADRDDAFIYADPPYFEKAGSLYLNAFKGGDHEALAECLKRVTRAKWILTYDNVPQVAALYSDLRRRLFALNYSAHRVMKANEIMVFSPELLIPEELEAAHVGLVQRMDDTTEGGS